MCKQVWRLENENGDGPFDGAMFEALSSSQWRKYTEEVLKSQAIYDTKHKYEHIFRENTPASKNIAKLVYQFDPPFEPVFGAPDRECFERWFPLHWRLLFHQRGYQAILYEVRDEYVLPGNSVAEVVFIPDGKRRPCDTKTLEPLT
ncbi:MAG: hypothetical protein ACTHJR_11245 [Sphingomonas sp.]|uniref:hypothetical protein n=1 Tax=Sphingomonas sp. TaxID=28214 RepID=UPI003F7E54DE